LVEKFSHRLAILPTSSKQKLEQLVDNAAEVDGIEINVEQFLPTNLSQENSDAARKQWT
jgi:hypothetical protein